LSWANVQFYDLVIASTVYVTISLYNVASMLYLIEICYKKLNHSYIAAYKWLSYMFGLCKFTNMYTGTHYLFILKLLE
jgi:hypothetical protein